MYADLLCDSLSDLLCLHGKPANRNSKNHDPYKAVYLPGFFFSFLSLIIEIKPNPFQFLALE